jgi:hypothetical protein
MDTSHNKAMTVHRRDGSIIEFTPSATGLYKHKLETNESIRDMWSLLSTVNERALTYTKRAYKRAMLASKFQNIIMGPDIRRLQNVIIQQLADCPITKADIQAADNIFGQNLGSLKGKTVRRPNIHVDGGVDPIPTDVIRLCNDITIAIDIMFVNKIPFLITLSREIKFTTVESIPNRQVTRIAK